LLLTIVAVLYSMWYPQLTQTLDTRVPDFEPDRRKPRRAVAEVGRWRAVPLALASCAIAAVFAPDVAEIARDSFRSVKHSGVAGSSYDSVATAFILVEAVASLLALHLLGMLLRFGRLLKELSTGAK